MQTVFVITVCRNAALLLEGTIKSVLSQTYANVKYIIIDGASTDGTQDIIRKYADKLAFWSSEPDKGIYDAMNKGLAKAREQSDTKDTWVNFMNAGDHFADDAVLEDIFTGNIINSDTLVIGGNTVNMYADGREETHHAEPSAVIPSRLPFSHQACISRLYPVWTFNTKYKYSADYEFLYKVYWQNGAQSIKTVDRAIARYRQEDSLSMVNANKVKGEYLSIQSAHRSWTWWKSYLKWRLLS